MARKIIYTGAGSNFDRTFSVAASMMQEAERYPFDGAYKSVRPKDFAIKRLPKGLPATGMGFNLDSKHGFTVIPYPEISFADYVAATCSRTQKCEELENMYFYGAAYKGPDHFDVISRLTRYDPITPEENRLSIRPTECFVDDNDTFLSGGVHQTIFEDPEGRVFVVFVYWNDYQQSTPRIFEVIIDPDLLAPPISCEILVKGVDIGALEMEEPPVAFACSFLSDFETAWDFWRSKGVVNKRKKVVNQAEFIVWVRETQFVVSQKEVSIFL